MPTGWRRSPAAADIGLVIVAAIWGITFPLVKNAVAGFPPIDFLAIRFVLASVSLIPILWRARSLRNLVDAGAIAPGACLAAGYWLQTAGLRTVGPSVSAFLTGTSVILVPFFGWLLRWERATPRRWIAVGLALFGIYLLQGRLPDRWSSGETMTAGCALMFAFQILLLGRSAPKRPSALGLGAAQIMVATGIFCLAAIGRPMPAPVEIPPIVWAAAAITGVFATALAFVFQVWAQARVPAGHVAVCFAAEPVFAAVFSVGLFADAIPPHGWAGAAAVMAGVLLVSFERSGRRRDPRREGGRVEGEAGLC